MADIYRSDIVPVDLNHALSRKHVGSVLATGDNGANRFGASVLRDGKAVDLTGCGVTAYFMRPGQNALVLQGKTDGHVAYVDLAQACYTLQSSFTLTIKVSGNGITSALRIIDGYILLTQTDALDAPAETVPTLDELLAQIAAMEAATDAAEEVVSDYNGKVAEQDATIAALSEDIDKIASISPNLFDKSKAVKGGYYNADDGQIGAYENGYTSLIPVSAGTYTFGAARDLFGTRVAKVPMFDSSGNYVKSITGTSGDKVGNATLVTYTISAEDVAEGVAFAGFTANIYTIDEAMYVKGTEYPAVYQPYGEIQLTSGMKQAIQNDLPGIMPDITPEMTTFVQRIQSENLFNKNERIQGGYFDAGTGGVVLFDSSFRCFIPVEAGTYSFAGSTGLFGISTNIQRIPLFDKDGNYVKTISGEKGADVTEGVAIIYTISESDIAAGVAFAGYSASERIADSAMYVRGSEYPAAYIAYENYLQVPSLRVESENTPAVQANLLYGKKVAFDGDSICHGTSAKDGLSGWAGRIGAANSMTWKNYGISGGTITAEMYTGSGNARHWISRSIDTIHAEMPDLDYLILEGGTNDADLLNESTQMGDFDLGDFGGTYDDATFCGALETLFYKAVTYYPNAKIGYIVAQRMGYNQYTSDYDTTGSKRYRFFSKAMEICKKWGIPYLNLWDTSHMTPKLPSMFNQTLDADGNIAGGYLYTDGQHLTPAGYERITPMIEAWMLTL